MCLTYFHTPIKMKYEKKVGNIKLYKKTVPKIVEGTKFTKESNDILREIFEEAMKVDVNIFTKKLGPKVFTVEIYCAKCKMHFKCTMRTRKFLKMKGTFIKVPILSKKDHKCCKYIKKIKFKKNTNL